MATITPAVRFNEDASWAFVGPFAVYPRDDDTYSFGRRAGVREWYDVETGFANMEAAIDQAAWVAAEQVSA